jgi:N-acetylmuramic acid 6-phosphate etherase
MRDAWPDTGDGLNGSPTEARNPRTVGIDQASTRDILELLNAEDALVPAAVARALDQLAVAVDLAHERVQAGGRVHYFGAGTSGRLAVLDAAELFPTFGLEPGTVMAHHAGGSEALEHAVEGAEDNAALGAHDAAAVAGTDFAMGLTASGRTPYVGGALAAARRAGAATALITSNPNPPLAGHVDVMIAVDTGPEAIAGSTRLKAGTAQKLLLNSFSTALMIRLGKTYSNLMTGLVATNSKLRGRLITLLVEATGLPLRECRRTLVAAAGDARVALVSLLAGCTPEQAQVELAVRGGVVRDAVATAQALRRAPAAGTPPPAQGGR